MARQIVEALVKSKALLSGVVGFVGGVHKCEDGAAVGRISRDAVVGEEQLLPGSVPGSRPGGSLMPVSSKPSPAIGCQNSSGVAGDSANTHRR